jgi:sulfite reductase alpha subunit-like flavoprotein
VVVEPPVSATATAPSTAGGAAAPIGIQEGKEGERKAGSDDATAEEEQEEEQVGFSADAPVAATVRAARYLTAGGATSTRRVAHVELDVSGTPISDVWGPGDAIGVLCPNPLTEVERLCKRLQLDPASKVSLSSSSGSLASHFNRVPAASSVGTRALLMQCVDIRWPMKKSFVRYLAEHCAARTGTEPVSADRAAADKHCLLLLCSKAPAGKALWAQALESQRATLLDVLCMFPSCLPPLGGLLSLLPPLAPRFYSISSTPLDAPARITFAFTVVSYNCGVDSASQAIASSSAASPVAHTKAAATELGGSGGIVRHGLATHFLEMVTSGLLRQSEAAAKAAATTGRSIGRSRGPSRLPSLRVFLRKARDFRPPASLRWPLILIGPGTGVAPFRGFLRHRQARLEGSESQRAAVCTGEWRGGFTIDFLEDDCAETSMAASTFLTGCTTTDTSAARVLGSAPTEDAAAAANASTIPTAAATAGADSGAAGAAGYPIPPKPTAAQRAAAATSAGSAEQARRAAAAAASLKASCGRPSGIRAAGTPAGAEHAASASQYGAGKWGEDEGLSPRAGLKALTGDTILFFGNRSPDVDFLYKEDWDELERGGSLNKLSTAFSRAETGPRHYVQHRIMEDGTAQRLARAILTEGAHVFVCGDGNAMAKNVHEALVKILSDFDARERSARAKTWTAAGATEPSSGGLLPAIGEQGAEQLLKQLAGCGRYVRDIWIG